MFNTLEPKDPLEVVKVRRGGALERKLCARSQSMVETALKLGNSCAYTSSCKVSLRYQ